MTSVTYPPKFLKLLRSVTARRPKIVIDHILKHGSITSEDLKDIYGYNHPPRAIRDVREQGIPITTDRVTGPDGRSIAAYRFGSPDDVRSTQLSGRTAFTSALKMKLIDKYGSRCNIYLEAFPKRELQIDHRVPFEISGDSGDLPSGVDEYMLLCASANRAKSWSCEHCPNWTVKDADVCRTCYWAHPESYTHIATRQMRRLDLLWSEVEVSEFEALVEAAAEVREEPSAYVKMVLRSHLKGKDA